jgi:outer membrane immunogenic protein
VDARLGATGGSSLFYLIGGYAFAKIEHSLVAVGGPFAPSVFRDMYHGWNVGAGFEQHIADNWSGRLEYRYYDFGDASFDLSGPTQPHRHALTIHTIRLGLSYRFATGKAPVTVRY